MEGFPKSKFKFKSLKALSEARIQGCCSELQEWETAGKVFSCMKWVENGRFELNIGGIEVEWFCGPFREVVQA